MYVSSTCLYQSLMLIKKTAIWSTFFCKVGALFLYNFGVVPPNSIAVEGGNCGRQQLAYIGRCHRRPYVVPQDHDDGAILSQ
jgi:hypothetical protein